MNRAGKQNNNSDDKKTRARGRTSRAPAVERSTAPAPPEHRGRRFSIYQICRTIYLATIGAIFLAMVAFGVRAYMIHETLPAPNPPRIFYPCEGTGPMPEVCLLYRQDHGSKATHEHWFETSAEYRYLCGERTLVPHQPNQQDGGCAIIALGILLCILYLFAPCFGIDYMGY
jgi:hypothetical protein